MNQISESIKAHEEAKLFRPANYDDFRSYIDYASTEEQLFSRLTYWFVFQGLPADQNEKYDMVRERASELKLWNGLNLIQYIFQMIRAQVQYNQCNWLFIIEPMDLMICQDFIPIA